MPADRAEKLLQDMRLLDETGFELVQAPLKASSPDEQGRRA